MEGQHQRDKIRAWIEENGTGDSPAELWRSMEDAGLECNRREVAIIRREFLQEKMGLDNGEVDLAILPTALSGKLVSGGVIVDSPGHFMMIPRHLIKVDRNIQRRRLRMDIINKIGRSFSWQAFLVLGVFKRPDSPFYFAHEGQHRVIGSSLHPSITELPCMVFEAKSLADEAIARTHIVRDRSSPKADDDFRCNVTAGDPDHLHILAKLNEIGYVVNPNGQVKNTVACTSSLLSAVKSSPKIFDEVIMLCAELHNELQITRIVFDGLFYLQTVNERSKKPGPCDEPWREKIIDLGLDRIRISIEEGERVWRKKTVKAWAWGIAGLLNGKRESGRKMLRPVLR